MICLWISVGDKDGQELTERKYCKIHPTTFCSYQNKRKIDLVITEQGWATYWLGWATEDSKVPVFVGPLEYEADFYLGDDAFFAPKTVTVTLSPNYEKTNV